MVCPQKSLRNTQTCKMAAKKDSIDYNLTSANDICLFLFFPKHLKQKSSLKEKDMLPVSSLQVIFKGVCGSSTSTIFTSRLSPTL